ncbi:hypothetical protein [Streptacidiphilus sp. P02-A3a]|uniref:DUF6912 family protein n=1 Tax=Streptacidiphilus sp. P02-A3a TaxID=2704468 RepID=UPI0015FE78C6|nr:hypothetical protein [Streptacidiphilus sp. P02-A3a]QMU67879.1 hypothetical protein GXP74_06190 [Streptacidiphilus sp. P02-A3a]
MRVYVPTTLNALALAHAEGPLGVAPLRAYAVTPALREWYLSDDIEELEYAALVRAAQSSLRLLAEDAKAPRRRVVVALDVPDRAVQLRVDAEHEHSAELGAVTLTEPLLLAKAAAVHADADEAGVREDVAAAAEAVAAADGGDEDARFTVDGAEDHELLWYAVQEIPGLLS